jgi:SnoaL-like domain
MSAQDDIRNLLSRYCEMIDVSDVDGLVELFAHAVLSGFEASREWRGRDEIRELYNIGERRARTSGGRATKHITTNSYIEVDEDAGTALARSSWVLLVSTSPDDPIRPILAGRYHDTFGRIDGAWQFTAREYLVDLSGSESDAVLRGPDR